MIHTLLLIILFWVQFFGVTMILHYIYNIRMWHPKPFSYWDKPPFNCHKCCTTWVLITTYIMAGLLLADVVYTLFGITLAVLYAIGLYKDEKEKFDYGKKEDKE